MKMFITKKFIRVTTLALTFIILTTLFVLPAYTNEMEGEQLYKYLLSITRSQENKSVVESFNTKSRSLDWTNSKIHQVEGNLRLLKVEEPVGTFDKDNLYMIRNITGEIYLLSIPEDFENITGKPGTPYSALNDMLQNKSFFKVRIVQGEINNNTYQFAQLAEKPFQSKLDKIFKISIVLMLFFVMVGMGLTLTTKDFALVLKEPRGVIFGTILQFGLMPLVALGIGHLLGFYELFPFIFVGMILVTATPGGATSNLMTYFANGDLALSISLTSFSTALSIFFTPLILALYCTNVPEVNMPVKMIMGSIFVLVLIPLIIGMAINYKWKKFAEKATTPFSILGIIALLFIIVAGVLSNIHVFADTDRYGVRFYFMVFCLTFLGMVLGAILTKVIGVNNYQTRAVSMEIGIRNVSLSMVLALLIQDYMGDFHSSMFVTSGIFGLSMYIAGAIAIQLYKKFLPVEVVEKIEISVEDESY